MLGISLGTIATGLGLADDVIDLFNGGSSGKNARGKKRQQLSALGFNYNRTKGYQPQDNTNIDGFGDTALDNMFRAQQEYGQVAIDLHNQGKFTKATASNYSSVKTIIEKESGSSIFDGGSKGSSNKLVKYVTIGATAIGAMLGLKNLIQ